jgi:hypothetical protein
MDGELADGAAGIASLNGIAEALLVAFGRHEVARGIPKPSRGC